MANLAPVRRTVVGAAILIGLLPAAGCETPPPPFLETVRTDEPLVESDIERLAAVLEAIGDDGRGALPSPFRPPPDWAADRTLPVGELVASERAAAERAWSPEAAAKRLEGSTIDTALAARAMTREQLCALVFSVGAAVSRGRVAFGIDLPRLARRGAAEYGSLDGDQRPFASLPPEEQAEVLRRARRLTVGDRAARLASVPEENVALAARHEARLTPLLPDCYRGNPFDGLYPQAEDLGVPFDESDATDRELHFLPDAPGPSSRPDSHS